MVLCDARRRFQPTNQSDQSDSCTLEVFCVSPKHEFLFWLYSTKLFNSFYIFENEIDLVLITSDHAQNPVINLR